MKKLQQRAFLEAKQNGITLIALVITIIVLLILAGITIAALSGENGVLNNASLAKLSTEFAGYKEEVDLYKLNKISENMQFKEETLTAGKTTIQYEGKPESEQGNIKDIIKSLDDKYLNKFIIINGILYIMATEETSNLEIKAAQNTGIEVMPYEITEDGKLVSSNANIALQGTNGTLTIPDMVTSIAAGSFSNVEGLKTVIIPYTVKTIEKDAFRNNSSLETVIMQEKVNEDGTIEGVESIGESAFWACSNLQTVQMANSITSVGSTLFYNDANLKNVNLPRNLKIISSYMFDGCKKLANIEIPEGVTEIQNSAFSGCTSLTEIKIPKSVISIDSTAFTYCQKLTNIDISENKNFSFTNGILLGNNNTEMIIILESAIEGNKFTIPNVVTKLTGNQLSNYPQITSVEIPEKVETISPGFINDNITEVIIDKDNSKYETYNNAIYTKDEEKKLIKYYGNEDNVKVREGTLAIGEYSFQYKTLKTIELPNSLESIERQAFDKCNYITNLKLGPNINNLDPLMIYNTAIEKVEFIPDEEGNINQNYSIRKAICNGEETDALFNYDGTEFILPLKKLGAIQTYEIPEGVKRIGSQAFHAQRGMMSIIIPNTVETISNSFNYCNALESIEIPNSVTKINSSCFNNSANLREIRIHKKEGTLEGAPWGCIYGDRAIFWVG